MINTDMIVDALMLIQDVMIEDIRVTKDHDVQIFWTTADSNVPTGEEITSLEELAKALNGKAVTSATKHELELIIARLERKTPFAWLPSSLEYLEDNLVCLEVLPVVRSNGDVN